MPGDAGVGLTDVGFGIPGTHQSKFSSEVMEAWAPNFYAILRTQLQRACASIGYLLALDQTLLRSAVSGPE